MKKINILKLIILLLVFSSTSVFSQEAWMVYFKDKDAANFNPYSYFDSKAIERRIKLGISLNDPTDMPVNSLYVNEVSAMVDEVFFISRWFNCVAVTATQEQLMRVKQLPFVLEVEMLEPMETKLASVPNYDTSFIESDKDLLRAQLDVLGISQWKNNNINGKGIRIAIFDGGFTNADKVPFFDHIRNGNRLIASKDFTKKKNGDYVYYGGNHGTCVWSCIAGKFDDIQIGLATEAEFLLAKTEKDSEFFREELNWAAAAEWADKLGADIINSSLGYTYHRYFNFQMNGKVSFVAKAANMAARKGMLVVNAAGNEGVSSWHKIGTPADADSVLSVGGINPNTGYHINFSSYGPTSDKRMKPNVVAFASVIAASDEKLDNVEGTSFASPLIAGFAACAWQTNRSLTNMQLFKEIEKSGSLYPYFDYAHGYGIPQADYFINKTTSPKNPTFFIEENDGIINVIVDSTFIRNKRKEVGNISIEESKIYDSKNAQEYPLFYYNIMNSKGVIDMYYVLDVSMPNVLTVDKKDFTPGETLNLFFAGYTYSIRF